MADWNHVSAASFASCLSGTKAEDTTFLGEGVAWSACERGFVSEMSSETRRWLFFGLFKRVLSLLSQSVVCIIMYLYLSMSIPISCVFFLGEHRLACIAIDTYTIIYIFHSSNNQWDRYLSIQWDWLLISPATSRASEACQSICAGTLWNLLRILDRYYIWYIFIFIYI